MSIKGKALLSSICRIAVAVVLAVTVIVSGLWLAVRQPNWGEHPFPDGLRAEQANLKKHVELLCTEYSPRNIKHLEKLNSAADYIKYELASAGASVAEQPYLVDGVTCRNIIGRFGPDAGGLVVVGAHYDVYGDLPGADDNASGVAGLLELARLLKDRQLSSPVELVAYSTEEPPFFGSDQMGSAVHARSLLAKNLPVTAMISLEMIGYYTEQMPRFNPLLNFIYPEAGDFVVAAGRWQDRGLAKAIKKAFRGANDMPCLSYSGTINLGADLSDHRNYWANGCPAVMVTDTANLRNNNYHTHNDTPETLDYERMADVVDGVLNAVIALSNNSEGS